MFDQILVPMDGSSLAECVLPHVVAIAKPFDSQIRLLQVLSRPESTGQFVDPLTWQMGKVEAQNYLDGILTALHSVGLKADCHLMDGHAANSIIEFAYRNQIQLIVLSSHGRSGLSVWNVSSVVQKITQRAHLPTLIVRAYQAQTVALSELQYETILIPLDLSQRAECALPIVSRLARYYKARLIVTHVVTHPEMPRHTPLTAEDAELAKRLTERNQQEATRYLKQIENRLKSKTVDVQTRLLLRDNIASALDEFIEQEGVDLVVMSAHGYSGQRKWPYGNVVEKLITYGSVPLLIYQDFRPDELDRTRAETAMKQHQGH